ncbi:RNA recognition motif domain-containing protein [Hirsutella rhossiliensis]|uniref:RNA recognition motif domain-containing protein n=1 Tax=Hirsutella rhossiliensis TaxID=111463 RepID=A0A9P8MTK8_9HYPO|nr:RNA recognition motif domain-containing protein [Hirsutella rhossiliensis]KAH0960924.1 RNA recognition motif domain-containing protein [Hirsutella rhossiliensis]
MSGRGGKLAPEVNRALFIKNLSYNVTPEELFDLFGKFGPIRQVRQGISNTTKGTAFVVYEDVMDAKQACDKLNGFNFQNRYLVVLYHQPEKMIRSKEDLEARREVLAKLKKQHGRSPTTTKSASPDPKTILRNGTLAADKTVAKGNSAPRAVRFVDVVRSALQLRA